MPLLMQAEAPTAPALPPQGTAMAWASVSVVPVVEGAPTSMAAVVMRRVGRPGAFKRHPVLLHTRQSVMRALQLVVVAASPLPLGASGRVGVRARPCATMASAAAAAATGDKTPSAARWCLPLLYPQCTRCARLPPQPPPLPPPTRRPPL